MSPLDMFSIVAILYCVTNLGSMGLELKLKETIKSLRSPRLVILTLVCNWKSGAGLTVNSEATFNWEAKTTNAYINIMAGGLTKLGQQRFLFFRKNN